MEGGAARRSIRGLLGAVLVCVTGAGCAILGILGDPDLSIALTVRELPPSDFRLEIDVDGRVFSLAADEERDADAPSTGDLPVTVRFVSEGDVLVTDSFVQTFNDSDDHWIHGLAGGSRPLGFCVGDIRAHWIPNTLSDTLFVVHGSIPKGAIC